MISEVGERSSFFYTIKSRKSYEGVKKFWGYYTILDLRENFFLELTALGVQTCRESEFEIFEAKKRFPDSKKVCVLKRKVAKMRFLPKNDLKMCGKSEFDIYTISRIQEKLYIDTKIRENNIFCLKTALKRNFLQYYSYPMI